jgi:hypothetical protein
LIIHSSKLLFKNPIQSAGRVAQVVECLLSNGEALSSNPIATKKKKKEFILAGWQWLMPLILRTQEAEFRRIAV